MFPLLNISIFIHCVLAFKSLKYYQYLKGEYMRSIGTFFGSFPWYLLGSHE